MFGKRMGLLLLVVGMVALGGANAWALLVYDSITGQTPYSISLIANTTDLLAQQFTTTSDNLRLDSVTLLMDQLPGHSGNAVVSIYTDNGANAPGVMVTNGLLSDPATYPTTMDSVVFTASNLLLTGSTSYWVVFQAQTPGQFEWTATQATANGFGPWSSDPPYYYINTAGDGVFKDLFDSPFEMAIYASNPSAVPEPSTYVLLGIALSAVGFARRKMKRCEG